MKDKIEFLKNISFFAHLPEESIRKLSDVIEQKVFQKNDMVFCQGDSADGMYIILFGDVKILIGNKVVAQLGIGDFFGEIALITSESRTASVEVSSETCSMLFLSKEAFEMIKYKINSSDQREVLRRISENATRN